jgi:hypothetical protein
MKADQLWAETRKDVHWEALMSLEKSVFRDYKVGDGVSKPDQESSVQRYLSNVSTWVRNFL